jgi:DNA mismatch repair protein MutS2
MDPKTLSVLEYPKILERVAANCDFSASADLARALEPTPSIDLARLRLQETTEARKLLVVSDASIGGAHDVREKVSLAARGGVLDVVDLLDVKFTLIACRALKKSLLGRDAFEKPPAHPRSVRGRSAQDGATPALAGGAREPRLNNSPENPYPRLSELALALPNPLGVVDVISRTISDKGEVLDSASPKLAAIRAEVRVARERLMTRLQKYLSDGRSAQMLQDSIITQRDGRYVIPLRSEHKGKIKAIVHDQSSSGATLFVEPLAVVELNNTLREAELAERDEIRRVLAEVSAQVGLSAAEIVSGVEALAELDLAFAKAKYAEEIAGCEPVLVERLKGESLKSNGAGAQPATLRQTQGTVFNLPTFKLLKARHPLIDPASAVANDIDLAPGTRAVVITGPNTGGKTVSLKTVGLLVAMAQSGLHIPAQSGSELPIFRDVYADIGDEQSIEQSLSTFSGHLTNIIRILKKIDARSLVILDELGAGTDPQEGAALARAILAHLLERGVTTFVATHYPELKTFAHSAEGVVNASLEFNVQTLRPTYKLTIGIPGRSNALAIAQRLGLPEAIVAAARSEVNPDELRADKLIDDIHRQRKIAFKESEKAEKARAEAHKQRRELNERLEKIEDERRDVLAQARAEGELEVEVLKRSIQSLRSQLQKLRQPLAALEKLEAKVEKVEEKVQQPVERAKPKTEDQDRAPSPPDDRRPLSLGERVIVRTLGSEGIVTTLGESDAEVQVGSLRIRAKLVDLARKSEEQETDSEKKETGKPGKLEDPPSTRRPAFVSSPGLELDLRGQKAEDALVMLESYLDKAYLSGMPFVRIIHGKGTGKLRQEVRAALKGHPQVTSFEEGHPNEGGDGVTVAKMVKE